MTLIYAGYDRDGEKITVTRVTLNLHYISNDDRNVNSKFLPDTEPNKSVRLPVIALCGRYRVVTTTPKEKFKWQIKNGSFPKQANSSTNTFGPLDMNEL